jgi:hypothetical protein
MEASVAGLSAAMEQLRSQLGDEAYRACVTRGEALSPAEATLVATDLISAARRKLERAS